MASLKTLTINGVTYEVTPVVPASSITLLASAWEGDGDRYSQVVTIPGVTSHTKVDLQPTSEQLIEFHYKVLAFVAENDGGVVTVYAIGDQPMDDHTIQITKTEVKGTGKIRGNTVGTTMPRPDWNQTDPTKADYILNKPENFGGGVGKTTEEGGTVFNDYKTNQAPAKFATAFGSHSGAFAPGAIASGFPIARSGANITYDEDGRQLPENEEDWRYNEVYGYGGEASGKGAVCYARAGKSLGYRTQVGYPPSAEIAALRPEAITYTALPFDITAPTYKGEGVTVDESRIVMERYTQVVYPASRGVLRFSTVAHFDVVPDGAHIEVYAVPENEEESTYQIANFDIIRSGESSVAEVEIPPRASLRIEFWNEQEAPASLTISDITYFPGDNVGQGAFAIGADTAALGNHAFAGGWGAVAKGYHSMAFGGHNEASGEYSIAFGNKTKATGYAAVAVGDQCEATKENCFAGGTLSKSTAGNSIAFGYSCTASTKRCVALGSEANASGEMGAAAIGHQVTANGKGATAMGSGSTAKGEGTFAVGAGTQATLYGAFAYGDHCIASNYNAIAGGANSVAKHANTGAIGRRVVTSRSSQFVVGQDNADASGALFVVGNGTSDTDRKNAFVVNADGSAKVTGRLSFGSIDAASRNNIITNKQSLYAPTNNDKGDYIGQIWLRIEEEDNTTAEVYMFTGENLGGWQWTKIG